MPLSEDQRALLRLLLAGDTYEQIAEMLGTTPDDVRGRAREASAELDREGDEAELATAARERLVALEGGDVQLSVPGAEAPGGSRGLPRLAWVTIAGALVALVAAFVVVQVSDDSDDANPAPARDLEEVIEIKLEPVGGSGARGTARIVRIEDRPALDVAISGLEPAGPKETYVLWLLGSGSKGLPIAFRDADADGRFVGRTEVPPAAAGLLPSIDFLDLSLAQDSEAAAAVRAAARSSTLPNHVGKSIIRGALPN